ncbi:MAG: hypothetical protein AB8G77_13900 [Rhodothermales bacterium]
MKKLLLFVSVLAATAGIWILFWLFTGQDLNLFARQVLPIPIAATFFMSSLFAGLITVLYRLAKGKWVSKFPRLLWSTWAVFTVTFITLLVTTSG